MADEGVDALLEEIRSTLGHLPPLLAITAKDPNTLHYFWNELKHGYLQNRLPALFKARVVLLLARTHQVVHWLPMRAWVLRMAGEEPARIVELLKAGLPIQARITKH